jgi:endonuclease G
MPRYSWTRSWQARSSVSVALATVSSTLFGSPRASSAEEKKASIVHHHLSHSGVSPISPIRIFRPNPYLEIAYDVRTRNPVYVLEQLQPELWGKSTKDNNNHNRRPHFTEEKMLPEMYRSRNSHYRHTEYDRGHMAPAADFVHDRRLLIDTFTLCNTAPQVASVNRKVWAALEDWTRKVARAANDHGGGGGGAGAGGTSETTTSTTTLVLTGPLFMPAKQVSDKVFQYQYAAIGQPPSLQSVPTHFFKVVVVVSNSDSNTTDNNNNNIQAFACFVIPNDDSVADETDLTQFVVPWTALEAVTGLEMFPSLTTSSLSQSQQNSAKQVDWKASADAVTRAVTVGQTNVLLLTDGKATSSSKRNPKNQTPLQHLCSQGQCQRPYKLLLSSFG